MQLFRTNSHQTSAGWAALAAISIACGSIAVVHARANDEVTRILWRDPGPIGAKDLKWGAGGPDAVPRPPFTFVAEDTSGTKPKVEVTDASGTPWRVKFVSATRTGSEVHAEIAAGRLMWALGYPVEETYYVHEGRFERVQGLRRAADAIGPDGSFHVARFEKRPSQVTRVGRWDLQNNPFVGSRELAGLKTLMMLIGNWDLKFDNTAILRVPTAAGGREDWYILSDVGTAFGRSGGIWKKASRWNLEHYADQRFMRGILRGRLEFNTVLPDMQRVEVPVEHARWFARLISQLSQDQVRQAFEAAGASPEEVDGFSTHVMARIKELQTAVSDDDARAR